MQEIHIENVQKQSFNNALVDIQNRLKVPKNQVNKFGGYKYRTCSDTLDMVKPLLEEHNMSLTITDHMVAIGDRVYVEATATITDGINSREARAYAREPLSKKGMDEPQITGTASTYARKYALNGLLAIDDTQDPDSMENTDTYTENHSVVAKKVYTERPATFNQPKVSESPVAFNQQKTSGGFKRFNASVKEQENYEEQENCFDPAEYM